MPTSKTQGKLNNHAIFVFTFQHSRCVAEQNPVTDAFHALLAVSTPRLVGTTVRLLSGIDRRVVIDGRVWPAPRQHRHSLPLPLSLLLCLLRWKPIMRLTILGPHGKLRTALSAYSRI